jgi:uncharacterized protein (DUF1800 family)
MDTSLRALNRFGLGARIGEAEQLGDPRAWLRSQLDGDPPRIAGTVPSASEIGATLVALRMANQAGPTEQQQARRRLAEIATAEERAVLGERVASERPFVERLVQFWSNHLAISMVGKRVVGALAGSYEREAIRPHVLGRFDEMVLASARHPAMLVYLDNFQSIGPNSGGVRAAARPAARRGLNENYARELLELHTLGVNGGYTQEDVQELAKILTGWTASGVPGAPGMAANRRTPPGAGAARRTMADDPVGFVFQPNLHEPGTKTLLGVQYGDGGFEEGERAIHALCAHPATGEFLARKLVAHFVADDPPESAVERVANVYRSSGGDLREVAIALIDLEEAWSDSSKKFRSPQDWMVAISRGLGLDVAGDRVTALLRQLRHPLWAPPSPAGFPDALSDWSDPDALLNRAELARTLAPRIARSHRDPRILLDLVDVPAGDALRDLLSNNSIPAAERLALGIASPAFQWR